MSEALSSPRPLRIRAPHGASVFELDWNDGTLGRIPHRLLRGYCPCARCQGHRGSIQFQEGGNLELREIRTIGNYALQLTWGDQHDSGLYSFRYLKCLCELAERDELNDASSLPELPRL